MKVITVANRKGGSGKSTCVSNLVVQASFEETKCAVIDMDPQKTLTNWWLLKETYPENIDMIETPSATKLPDIIGKLKKAEYEFCFIDTPGYEDSNALESIKIADVVVFPCKPLGVDLDAGSRTIAFCKQHKKNIVFVFSQVLHKTNLMKDLLPIISSLSREGCIAPEVIYSENDFAIALGSGKTIFDFDKNKGKCIKNIYNFIKIICKE